MTMTQRQVAQQESVYSHRSPRFITLHTGGCILYEVHLISGKCATVHFISSPDMRSKEHILSATQPSSLKTVRSCFVASFSWKQLFLLKFLIPLPLPLPFFFFKVTSLIALCCAIGVMLRVCCVICCYASTSGMWVLYPFYSSSLPLCLKRTNNPVTTIDNTA